MADGTINDLPALTGAGTAAGDKLAVWDADAETTKGQTLTEHIAALRALGLVGAAEFGAAGDVLIGTGAGTYDNLAIGTAAGAALVADPHATNKVSVQYAQSLEERYRGTTGSLASTYDRALHAETNNAALSSGRLNLYRILLPKGLSIATISFWSMTTALSVGSNQWFALFDSARAKLAVTADDTSTAWAANTKKALTVASGPFVTTYAGWYYLGICVVATTPPSLLGVSSTVGASAQIAAPVPAGTSNTGLTNPASCPSTANAPTANTCLVYAELA